MLPVDLLSTLAANKFALDVLKKVADSSSVRFKDILEYIYRESKETKQPRAPLEEVRVLKDVRVQAEDAVKVLKDAELIKEKTAPIEDFNSYYVTSEGLSAARELRRSSRSSL